MFLVFCFSLCVVFGCPGGGFGGPGGGFLSTGSSSGLPLLLPILKPPPGRPKPPGKLVRVENYARDISGRASLIMCGDWP